LETDKQVVLSSTRNLLLDFEHGPTNDQVVFALGNGYAKTEMMSISEIRCLGAM
jgi:hypothetical protein